MDEPLAEKKKSYQSSPNDVGEAYTIEETEFLKAVDAFKRRTGRKFPTCTEMLAVLKSLGYKKS